MRRVLMLVSIGVLLTALAPSGAQAGPVMHINAGTAYLVDGEVHPITSPSITIQENSTGPTLLNPMLLILGIPNTSGFSGSALTVSTGSADLGGSGSGTNTTFGASYNGATGQATANGGVFNSGEVYSFLGLTGADTSNTFESWSDAELAVNNLSTESFGIFVYELTNTGISGGHTLAATFSDALPYGTFVLAYGRDNRGRSFDTPFTEAGLDPPGASEVPEPGSLVLLASGLILVARQARRRSA